MTRYEALMLATEKWGSDAVVQFCVDDSVPAPYFTVGRGDDVKGAGDSWRSACVAAGLLPPDTDTSITLEAFPPDGGELDVAFLIRAERRQATEEFLDICARSFVPEDVMKRIRLLLVPSTPEERPARD